MLFGILFIGLGVLLLTAQILNLSFINLLLTYWPTFFIILGLVRLLERNKSKRFSLIILLFGIIVQFAKLNYFTVDLISIAVAVALIFLGIHTLLDEKRKRTIPKDYATHVDSKRFEETAEDYLYENKDFLNDRFLFTNDVRIYQSDTFSGGEVEADFSNVTLDLKNVWPLESEIYLSCIINFATLTLDVPEDWHIIVNGKHYYSKNDGGTEEKAVTLIVESKVFLGSLKII